MRLTTVILIISLMQVSAAVLGQKIKLSKSNAPLKTVLKELRLQSGYNFIYTDNLLAKSKPVNIKANNVDFVNVLEEIFRAQPIVYVIKNNTVTLSERKKALEAPSLISRIIERLEAIVVQGSVVDEKGEPLPGVSIVLKSGKVLGVTDNKGYFEIKCPDENAVVNFSFIGYLTQKIAVKAILAKAVITMKPALSELLEVGIAGSKTIGTKVDLAHREHETLAQVLEGGVPGLTLKQGSETTVASTLNIGSLVIDLQSFIRMGGVDGFPATSDGFRQYLASPLNAGTVETTTTTNNNMIVPELRGASGFAGNTAGMLVVIDGFPQEGFPANYPMNNVVSVEVIRDPEECLKWGSAGVGGVILIKTKSAEAGALQINYSSNFYFSPPPDISAAKLRLASSAQVLDYDREVYDKNIIDYGSLSSLPVGFSPAKQLLYNLSQNLITEGVLKTKWDSLSRISNRDQLRLLQQSTFSQNHSLSLSGGTKAYHFNASGVYGVTGSQNIGTSSKHMGLNLKNDFLLLKDKLKITWIANLSSDKKISTPSSNGSNLPPDQLLLDNQGRYVYNYTSVTPQQNSAMLKAGYYDSGVNPLEDLRSNSNTSKMLGINSNLNLNWQLAPGLNWYTGFTYVMTGMNTESLQGAASSNVRNLVNQYGSAVTNSNGDVTGVDFYLPYGDIFQKTSSSTNKYDMHSGLNFERIFGGIHQLKVSIDAGLSDQQGKSDPNASIYGYNRQTGKGLPVLGNDSTRIINFSGSSMNPGQLVIPGQFSRTYARNVNLNANLLYTYLGRYSVQGTYYSSMVPNFGHDPAYATTSSSSVSSSWQINKEEFFKIPWISNLKLTAKASAVQVAKLAAQIGASVIQQPLWGNGGITVASFNPSQMNGQKNQNYGGRLDAGFSNNNIELMLDYSLNSISNKGQWNGRLSYNIGREKYFNVPWISSLQADLSLVDINPYQAQSIVMGAGSLSPGGGFNIPVTSIAGILPPSVKDKEAHVLIGVDKDRFSIDMRYYNKTIAGLGSGTLPTDPATGLSSQLVYSNILNKGLELALRAKVIQNSSFSYTVTLNGAYNVNQALDVPPVNFSFTSAYTTAIRNGSSMSSLWSFPWAGLDAGGNPQVYNTAMKKVSVADPGFGNNSFSLVDSGPGTAPWSGGLIQEWQYKNFFASMRMMFYLGNVMRRYMPALNGSNDNSIAIADRWKKPGDENTTDVAGVAPYNSVRELIIQYSSNSIMSAGNVRLSEIQFGYSAPNEVLKNKFIKSLTLSAQVNNVALWTKNNLHVDPQVVSNIGIVGITVPRMYSLTVNMSF
ncbi:SusC/RagA family TonB-linked outer membrane protein [Pedobacter cryoconitis]|uniref:Secretin/TonB short N-terminal domain-containing protein n=1 Tax=Pedobacter cryoconitis TaxID=188932 RepID=A0A7X0J0T7_9SPHI|nr:SusC/RagA family TonB-linked outer membrane protein [Pedobacter cryoconitis]MBB6498943.1 hypothetical protein [Pedobacter cryoconitis]